MDTRHIPTREWKAFFRAFSRERADWEVIIETDRVRGARGKRERVVDEAALREIDVEDHALHGMRLIVRAATPTREVRHVVAEPLILAFTELCSGPAGLQIDSPRCRTRIYVRPFRPVVGMVEAEDRRHDESLLCDGERYAGAGSRGARLAKWRDSMSTGTKGVRHA